MLISCLFFYVFASVKSILHFSFLMQKKAPAKKCHELSLMSQNIARNVKSGYFHLLSCGQFIIQTNFNHC